ncbi:MAG: glycosyltransferase family 39 protein, partial [Anaerolineaceae bacterium]
SGFSSIFDPIFMHIQGVWLFTLGRSENLFFLVQWFSLVVSMVTIYKISRSLKFSITNSLISALVGLSMPVVLLQTYSFQGDLSVAVFVLLCISFFIDWLNSKSKLDLVGAGLALLLALGTKKAAFLSIPILGIFIMFWLIGRLKNKKIIPWVTFSVTTLLITGMFVFGHLIIRQGGALAGVPLIYDSQVSTSGITEKVRYNFPRYLYQLIGLDGLPRVLQNDLIPIKAELFQKVIVPSSINLQGDLFLQPGFNDTEKFLYNSPIILNEDSSWFGPLGFLILPISIIISLFSKQKNRKTYSIFVSVFFITFFLMVIIQRPGWDPYQGRYFILPILPMIPLVSILIPDKRIWKIVILIIIIPLSLFLSVNTFLANNSKPIINQGTFWRLEMSIPENTPFRRTIKNYIIPSIESIAEAAVNRRLIYDCPYWDQVYYSDYGYLLTITFFNSLIPDKATVFISTQPSALDYGLFGKNKDRILIHVNEISEVSMGYFIINSESQLSITNNVKLLGDNGMYKVYFIKK